MLKIFRDIESIQRNAATESVNDDNRLAKMFQYNCER